LDVTKRYKSGVGDLAIVEMGAAFQKKKARETIAAGSFISCGSKVEDVRMQRCSMSGVCIYSKVFLCVR